MAGPGGLRAADECGGGQAEEHRDCGEVMRDAGAAGLGGRGRCSWRVAADRVGGEDGRADEAGTCRGDQRSSRPRAEREIASEFQAGGTGQDQGPGHGEVRGLDPAARPEGQRADRMAPGPVSVPGGSRGHECRDEDRPGSQSAGQQAAGPSGWPAMRASGFHGHTVASQAAVRTVRHLTCTGRLRGQEIITIASLTTASALRAATFSVPDPDRCLL